MASNTIIQSASSSHATMTYDVFVSFCGEDTRNNFTGFLFQALHRKGIRAFKDDEDIKKGESIAPELLQAIHMSRIFIVVFSKNYASSTWCLRELVEICNCIETSKRHILPIFYDVDPSEVRKQSGYYQKALAKHVERFKEDKMKVEEVQRWRETLTQVANFSGWDIRNKPQCVKIEEIVQKIINILSHKFSSLGNDGLIGMESRVEELANLLCLGSANDVRVVGISGISGIGKSTLARALYEKFSYQYDICCFIDDVSKSYRYSKALGVQKQLLSQLLNENNLKICNFSEGTCLAQNKLRNAKALIVFDNVDQVEQLKIFTGRLDDLSNELGYLTWYKFPFVSLPPSFQPNNLVEVFLRESNIKILWAGKKSLPNLRILDLSYSKGLLEMPNLEEALNLERLNLEGCIQLRWIDPSISLLKKLTVLNLKDCKNVVSLPGRVLILNSLECLNLSGCSKLNIILSLDEPGDPEHLKKLCMDARLLHLFFSSVLKDSISCLLLYLASYTGLRELDLNFCNIFAIPEAIGNMLSLEILNLSGNNFVTLPSLKQLSKLIHLNLSYCKWLKYLPQLPSQTHHLLSHIYMPPRSFLHFSDERGAGLYVFNCPKLVERECYISKSSLWMKQIVQANHQYQLLRDSNFGPTIEVMVPGSDIPRKTDLAMSPQKTKRAFPIYFPMFLNEDLVMSISDHMWLFYYTSLQLLSSCDALRPTCLGDMKLEFEIMNWEGFHFEVKKYGHRWVYEEDLKLLNSRKMRSRNSKAQKDKLSAIKENN
ncbi:hypothetical protein VNO78_06469 [Psophocarpus tetragonolobus]|uniref:TIR domain-containing protein n=1 Tax=Psophocarpus tetragonolobus TaxID=3891 RepID=A0AAN9SV78_PSOTE